MASHADREETWCTIESDPGVFTELIEMIGVKDVSVEELYDLDFVSSPTEHIYGLVFLFKWQDEKDARVPETDYPGVFFANQVVPNACATQALLSILLNCDESVDIGPHLTEFKQFTESMPPDLKGLTLTNATVIRNAHNSFRPPDSALLLKQSKKGKAEDAYHYVSYLPILGHLWELDGLKRGPLKLGPCTKEDWLKLASETLKQRIEQYANSEFMFSLMALSKSPAVVLAERHAFLEAAGEAREAAEVVEQLKQYQDKREKWRRENIRRRHDYTAFIVNMLTELAKAGKLDDVLRETIAKYGEEYITH